MRRGAGISAAGDVQAPARRAPRWPARLRARLAAAVRTARWGFGRAPERVRVLQAYPHDPGAFTQGLAYADGFLYESTGVYGESSLRQVRVETGEVIRQTNLPADCYAEGLAARDGKLFQLTWQSGIGFVYDLATLALERTFDCRGESWGLTSDGRQFIRSDGTDALYFLDRAFRETGRVAVRDRGRPVGLLNDLEFVRGEVLANVLNTERIARIDPACGAVIGWIDLRGLREVCGVTDPEAVLNGIACDATGDRLFVTGKLWPRLFQIARPGQAGVANQSR